MLSRAWWKLSPSSGWLSKRDDEETTSGVWSLEKRKDPLAARALSHWGAEYERDDVVSKCGNSAALLEEHGKVNGPAVRTRFPPEPNGYLHIGHAKSMNMNFGLAFARLKAAGVDVDDKKKETVFRYDDTNPDKESKEFVESLRNDVAWMGWTPFKTTHTSDYFDCLYEMALELVGKGLAYVCDQSSAEIEACRNVAKARAALRKMTSKDDEIPEVLREEARLDEPEADKSPYRNRSVSENLRLFEAMRRGECDEGSRTLRLKMQTTENMTNYNMFDQVAYRVKFKAHPHVGDKWCVYPTYDYTHCVIDSLEHIDYSICTLEFETRRESYYWVLDALDAYRPKVFEMSRLNLTYTILSKRKLTKLVDSKRVRGWNDPRMPTVSGLRRRGYAAKAVNDFCDDVGVTRNENYVEYERLQHFARLDLEPRATRRMCVKRPLRLELFERKVTDKDKDGTDTEEEEIALLEPLFPSERTYEAPELPGKDATYPLTLTKTVYIDRDDFQEDPDETFFGLAPGRAARLRHAAVVECVRVVKNEDNVESLQCVVLPEASIVDQPKGKLHWVSDADAAVCELRDYEHLFLYSRIDDDKWEDQLNPASETVYAEALVHKSLTDAKVLDAFQFERVGFYVVDDDSTPGRVVFNRTLDLRSAAARGDSSGAKKSRSRKDEQAAQLAKKNAAKAVSPNDMFKLLPEYDGLYSNFDDDGFPTHDAAGEPLSKNAVKKLKKDKAKHEKIFNNSKGDK